MHCNSPADSPQKSCKRCSKDKRSKAQFSGFPYLPFLTVFSGYNLTFWTMKYPTNSKRLNLLNSWFNAFNLWTSQWVSVLIIAFTCSYACTKDSYTKSHLEQVCMHMNLFLLPFWCWWIWIILREDLVQLHTFPKLYELPMHYSSWTSYLYLSIYLDRYAIFASITSIILSVLLLSQNVNNAS